MSLPRRVLLAQVLVAVILTAAAWMIGKEAGLSALAGALTCILPNGLFVAHVTGRFGSHPGKTARGLMGWEVAKLLLTAALFVVSFVVLPRVEPLALFGVFIACVAVYAATPLLARQES